MHVAQTRAAVLDDDMHQNTELKRVAETGFPATRFRARPIAGRV